jgi:hypothetical protein
MSLLRFRSRISPHGRSCGWQIYLRQVWPYGKSRRCNVSMSLHQMSGTDAAFACRMNGANHMRLAVRTTSRRGSAMILIFSAQMATREVRFAMSGSDFRLTESTRAVFTCERGTVQFYFVDFDKDVGKRFFYTLEEADQTRRKNRQNWRLGRISGEWNRYFRA